MEKDRHRLGIEQKAREDVRDQEDRFLERVMNHRVLHRR